MSNVSSRTRTFVHREVSVPIWEGHGVTRRDAEDLLFFADQKYRELHAGDSRISEGKGLSDDTYMIEPRDTELVAVIKVEQK